MLTAHWGCKGGAQATAACMRAAGILSLAAPRVLRLSDFYLRNLCQALDAIAAVLLLLFAVNFAKNFHT